MKKFTEMYKASFRELSVTRNLVLCGLMAALGIVLGMVATISIGPYLRIGFSGLPNRAVDFMLGPAAGCFFGAVLDLLKYILSPTGPYFFGFTLSSMLCGIIYGSLLYRKPVQLKRIIIAELIVKIFINCILNTFWLSLLYGDAYFILLPARVLKNIIQLPMDVFILFALLTFLKQVMKQIKFSESQEAA